MQVRCKIQPPEVFFPDRRKNPVKNMSQFWHDFGLLVIALFLVLFVLPALVWRVLHLAVG
jgi:hypothetical protein